MGVKCTVKHLFLKQMSTEPCRHLLDLPADTLGRILALLDDGRSLARAQAACAALRAQVHDELWRGLVLLVLGIRSFITARRATSD